MRILRHLSAAAIGIVALTGFARAQTVRQFRLTEEMRISGETESLGSFRTIAVGRDGRVVIPQNDDGHVRVYDATGKKLGTFGRRGRGPGEFSSYFDGTMGWHGDTLWIFDFNQRRITLMSSDLKLVRAYSTVEQAATAPPAANPARRLTLTNLHAEKVYANETMLTQHGFGPQDPESFSSTDRRYVLINLIGDIVREIVPVPPSTGRVHARIGNAVHSSDVPFATRAHQAVSPDGNRIGLVSAAKLSGDRGSYTVTVVRTTGDTVFSRGYSYIGARIPRARIDSAMSALQERGRGPEGAGAGAELAAKARPLLPDLFPYVKGLRFGDDDTIWLEIHDPGPNPRYRALDARGNPGGELVLPDRSVLVAASTTQIWVIEYDEDRVPSLVRYRIR